MVVVLLLVEEDSRFPFAFINKHKAMLCRNMTMMLSAFNAVEFNSIILSNLVLLLLKPLKVSFAILYRIFSLQSLSASLKRFSAGVICANLPE